MHTYDNVLKLPNHPGDCVSNRRVTQKNTRINGVGHGKQTRTMCLSGVKPRVCISLSSQDFDNVRREVQALAYPSQWSVSPLNNGRQVVRPN